MLLMAEKAFEAKKKANNKYMKNYDKKVISSYLMYLDANNLYGCAMSQKLPVNDFEWVKKLSKFDERFIKNYDENGDKGYFLEVDGEYPKNLYILHNIYHFYARNKLKNIISLFVTYATKKTMLCI